VNLQDAIRTYLPLIEGELHRCLAAPDGEPAPFYGMLHYHLGWTDEQFRPVQGVGGKRLRPLFALLCCQAANGEPERALPAAAALELLHNFSLIHDDIQDSSLTRRGRSTVWSLWGIPQAINAGDAMFTLAHLALRRLADAGLPAARLAAAWQIFDEACLALCRGQHMDIAFEAQLDVGTADYLRMIGGKTAALLGCAGQLGALVATGDEEVALHYRRLGESLGVAFQIQDDVLGIWGQTARTGKPVADDIRSGKKSLPVVYGLGQPRLSGTRRLRALYEQAELSEAEVAEVISLLDAAGARAYAEQLAGKYLRAGLAELEQAQPEPGAAEALRELADFLVSRSK